MMFDCVFRLNPIFKITLVEELTDKQKNAFRRVLTGRKVHSLLHAPREANFTVKALNKPLSEFLEYLREPKKIADLPADYKFELDKDTKQLIVQLVLDGVIEIKFDDSFISGVEAYNKVISPSEPVGIPEKADELGFIQKISRIALDFVLKSPYKHPRDLAWILYNFNRVPMHRKRRIQLPDEEAVLKFLDLNEDGSWDGMPDAIKCVEPQGDKNSDLAPFFQIWRSWKVNGAKLKRDKVNYKVYISPLPDEMPEVFKIVREKIVDAGANSMKTGRVTSAILRPDKLIVYFSNISDALDFANDMIGETSQFKGQGVPFSFQLFRGNQLISIGVDPPPKFGLQNSWRRYVTDKLALAIQGADRANVKDRIKYIRTHMRVFGVDIDEWRTVNKDWTIEFDLK